MDIRFFDGHCDTAWRMFTQGESLLENGGHWDLKRAGKYTGAKQVFALYADDRYAGDFGRLYDGMLENFLREIGENSDAAVLCTTIQETDRAEKEGKIAAFLSIEGGELIDCDPDKLEKARDRGVRMLNPVWNHDNLWCGSVNGSGSGLTAKGRDMVKKAQELGIILDVSHMSDRGFWDLCELTDAPFIASHSNSRAVWRAKRNLTDEQFLEIKRRGGTVGINLYRGFLGPDADIDTILRHVEHFIRLGGEDNISLGCDFDGCDELPDGISGVQDIDKIYSAVLTAGYSRRVADKLFHDNLNRQVGLICVT